MARRDTAPHVGRESVFTGTCRSVNHGLKRFHEDLERIGLRPRRQHDLRRSFITLARTDGARKDVLEVMTHGSRGDIVDVYTSLPWPLLCDEIAKLHVEVRVPKVVALPKAAATGGTGEFGTVLGTVAARAVDEQQKSPEGFGLPGSCILRGGRDSKASLVPEPERAEASPSSAPVENSTAPDGAREPSEAPADARCTNVPSITDLGLSGLTGKVLAVLRASTADLRRMRRVLIAALASLDAE